MMKEAFLYYVSRHGRLGLYRNTIENRRKRSRSNFNCKAFYLKIFKGAFKRGACMRKNKIIRNDELANKILSFFKTLNKYSISVTSVEIRTNLG